MNRSVLMQIHMLVAAFILPAAILYPLTGALYTWGIKGGYESSRHSIKLQQPLVKDKQVLQAMVEKQLTDKEIEFPSGKAKIKSAGHSFMLEWTGANIDVQLQPTAEPLIAELVVKHTTLYRRFVQLHKAKGGLAFKVYAAIFAVALSILLLSGFIMALKMPKFRLPVLISLSSGIVVFMAMVFSS